MATGPGSTTARPVETLDLTLPRTVAAFGSPARVREILEELSTRYPTQSSNALRLFQADRGRCFRYWHRLAPAERRDLLAQVEGLDLDLMERNLKAFETPELLEGRTAGELSPPLILQARSDPHYHAAVALGEEVLKEGWLALVEGAGGTGSRFFKAAGDLPKGLYPISATQLYTFFEVRLSHLKALRRRYGRPIPYIIMVSDATDLATRAYFDAHDGFGLRDEIRIVRQRSLPYLEKLGDGQYDLVLEAPSRLAMGGYGHADFTKHLLLKPEVLTFLERFGTRYVQWLQIDNPLAAIGHRHLLGAHRIAEPTLNPAALKMSFIALNKVVATEKAGVLVRRGGGLAVWEYSDMDIVSQHLLQDETGMPRLAVRRAGAPQILPPSERLEGDTLLGLPELPSALAAGYSYRWGAINPNLVVVSLESVRTHPEDNPPLVAMKSCRHLSSDGTPGDPGKKFIKFEAFLFDGLNDGVVVADAREACFAPTKNAEGDVDSPVSARALLNRHAASALEALGWSIDLAEGTVVELGGLTELSKHELAKRVGRSGRIDAGGILSIEGLEVAIGDGLHVHRGGALYIRAEAAPVTSGLDAPPAVVLPAHTHVSHRLELSA